MKKSELKQIIKEVIQEALPPTEWDTLRKKFDKTRREMTKKLAKDLIPKINETLRGKKAIDHAAAEHFTVKEVVDTVVEYDDHNLVTIFAICTDRYGRKHKIYFITIV